MRGGGARRRKESFFLVATIAVCLIPPSASAEMIVEDVAVLSPNQDGGVIEVLENGDLLAIASTPTRVVRIDEDGTMTTVAGGGSANPGNGGPATEALLPGLSDIEPLADGGFLVGTTGAVQRVDSDGTINIVAGQGSSGVGFDGDGGPAGEAKLGSVIGISSFGDGYLISERNAGTRVRFVDASGEISTVAGGDEAGFEGDDGPATEALLADQGDVDATDDGGFLIADAGSCRIREVDALGEINTVAGSGPSSIFGPTGNLLDLCGPIVDNWRVDLGVPGPALEAELNLPLDVAAEPGGGFVLTTRFGNHILRGTPGGAIEIVAGNGLEGWGGDGCPAGAVAADSPTSVTVADGAVYFVDEEKAENVLHRVSEGEVTDCDLIGLDGSPAPDEIDGSGFREKIKGNEGGDEIAPEGGKDTIAGGSGGDEIDVKGGGTDSVNCGSGRDVVIESGRDDIANNCEVVR